MPRLKKCWACEISRGERVWENAPSGKFENLITRKGNFFIFNKSLVLLNYKYSVNLSGLKLMEGDQNVTGFTRVVQGNWGTLT